MIHPFIRRWKTILLLTASVLTFSTISNSAVNAKKASPVVQSEHSSPVSYLQFGEWLYNPKSAPPVLMWWNQRMPIVPTLYIRFLPDRIIVNAVTPIWPDIGLILYIKDKAEKEGITLTLNRRDKEHCYYQAIIYGAQNQQNFINNITTSRKARLITPSSYSQSMSLNGVYDAMKMIISSHQELHFTLPDTPETAIMMAP